MAVFAPELVSQLVRPEGTITFRYTFPVPLEKPPTEPIALLETPPASGVVARLEIDPKLNLSFSRAAGKEPLQVARIDLRSLLGSSVLQIYLVWSPQEVRLHVGSQDRRGKLLEGSSST